MAPSLSRSQHLDSVLTGLALFQAYLDRDTDALAAMTAATSPDEAVKALLASMELLSGIFATQIGTEPEQVTDSVRRRIIRELVDEAKRAPAP